MRKKPRPAEHGAVDEDREEQGERGLQRDHEQLYQALTRTQCGCKSLVAETAVGEDGREVVGADELADADPEEGAAAAAPVGDAHPQRHEHRDEEEDTEDHDHRRREQPSGCRLAAAEPGGPHRGETLP